MKFGLYISEQHPTGSMAAHLEDHLEQVRVARGVGFDSVFAGHHYLSEPYQSLQPMPLLARVAAEAGEMEVGVGILLTALLNPVDVVEQVTTLDIITKGHFVFGVGLGYRDVEFDAFAVAKDERVRIYLDGLEIMRRLWSGERVSARSPRWHLDDVQLNTFPLQRPHPPIWMAANGDSAVRRAARHGDTWFLNPHARLPVLERQMAIYLQTLDQIGKAQPAVIPIIKDAFVAESTLEAQRIANPYLEAKYQVYVHWGQHKPLPSDDQLDTPIRELARERFIVGDPEEVATQIDEYRSRLGVNHMIFRLQWPGRDEALRHDRVLEAIELIGKQVIPALTSSKSASGAATTTDSSHD